MELILSEVAIVVERIVAHLLNIKLLDTQIMTKPLF